MKQRCRCSIQTDSHSCRISVKWVLETTSSHGHVNSFENDNGRNTQTDSHSWQQIHTYAISNVAHDWSDILISSKDGLSWKGKHINCHLVSWSITWKSVSWPWFWIPSLPGIWSRQYTEETRRNTENGRENEKPKRTKYLKIERHRIVTNYQKSGNECINTKNDIQGRKGGRKAL